MDPSWDLHEKSSAKLRTRLTKQFGQFDMTLIHKDYSRTPTGALELGSVGQIGYWTPVKLR